jgi:hypothetical protein
MRKMKLFGGLAVLCALVGLTLSMQGDVSAASFTARVQVGIVGTLSSASNLTDDSATLQKVWTTSIANGVGAGQADKIYTLKEQTIADGGTLSIDVKGSLTDAFGAAFTPAKLRAVAIVSCGGPPSCSSAANTTNLTLFGDANGVPILNTAATTSTLTPGGSFVKTDMSTAGIAVTAGTGDIIKIVNAAGAAAKVDVVLIGTSS